MMAARRLLLSAALFPLALAGGLFFPLRPSLAREPATATSPASANARGGGRPRTDFAKSFLKPVPVILPRMRIAHWRGRCP